MEKFKKKTIKIGKNPRLRLTRLINLKEKYEQEMSDFDQKKKDARKTYELELEEYKSKITKIKTKKTK